MQINHTTMFEVLQCKTFIKGGAHTHHLFIESTYGSHLHVQKQTVSTKSFLPQQPPSQDVFPATKILVYSLFKFQLNKPIGIYTELKHYIACVQL